MPAKVFTGRHSRLAHKPFQPNRDLLWLGGRRMRVHDPGPKARVFHAAVEIRREMRIRCAWIVLAPARDEDALLAEKHEYGQ